MGNVFPKHETILFFQAGVNKDMAFVFKNPRCILHKIMAKFGLDYVLPPKHQSRYLDVDDITCKEDFEILLKSTTKEPSCIKSSNVIKLIERGWAIRILDN